MLDFCYVTNYVTLFSLYFGNPFLLSVCFAWSNGPVAVAIWGWRNSVVYHSLDKVTTFVIHISPIVVSWCVRSELVLDWKETCLYGILGYVGWQLFYLFMTEWVFRRKLDMEPSLLTSLRWLSRDTKGAMHVFTKRCAVWVGYLEEDTFVSSEDRRIKMILVVAQFVYTCVCVCLLVPLTFFYESVQIVWIYVVFGIAAWNGAGFYFSVFKRGDYDRAVLEGRMGLYAIATAPPEKKRGASNGDDVKRKEESDDVKTKGD